MKDSTPRSSVDDPSFHAEGAGEELMGGAQELSSQREAEEFERHWLDVQPSVRAFLTGYLSDRSIVDDCVQEVALLAWKKGPVREGPERLLAFSLACAKRIAMSEVRRTYRTRRRMLAVKTLASLAELAAEQEREEMDLKASLTAALRGCLDELDAEPRRLLDLRYVSKDRRALTKEAKSRGYTTDAVYKKLERIRALLRDCVTRKLKEKR
ncbi:sigma factor [Haloferula sargassicola]|uniref:RNA polymerase sigma-70 region 2 domain-containing protein n=1 Tax=Haloferula sargassicola TaxID=490096 RepID=A0ABP9UMK8_9BACT